MMVIRVPRCCERNGAKGGAVLPAEAAPGCGDPAACCEKPLDGYRRTVDRFMMTATESFMSVSQVLHGVLMEQFRRADLPPRSSGANGPRKVGKSSCQDSDGRIRFGFGAARIARPWASRGSGDRGVPPPDTDLAKPGDTPEFRTQRQHRLRASSPP